jgi:hypothetical protein
MIDGEAVNVKDFGAKGDGVTDDTAAVQAAIDFCLSTTLPLVNGQSLIPQLRVSGMCRITAPLIIDRPLNQTGFFRIIGDGVVGGFVATTATSIFSTSNAFYATQLSNQVSFENLTFQGVADGGTLLIYAIDVHRYVRTQIKGCFFQIIRLCSGNSPGQYVQSLYITNTFVRACPGKWMDVFAFLDVHVSNSLFEGILEEVFFAGSDMNVFTLRDCVLEFNRSDVITTTLAQGVVIDGNYVEDNFGHFVKFSGIAGGVVVSNNVIGTLGPSVLGPGNSPDPNWFEILIAGDSVNFFGYGNTGLRLYEFTGSVRNATYGVGDIVKTAISAAPPQLAKNETLINQTIFPVTTFKFPITLTTFPVPTSTVQMLSGFGTPEGVITANEGSLYLNRFGGAGTTLYIKESGTGNTGWVAK